MSGSNANTQVDEQTFGAIGLETAHVLLYFPNLSERVACVSL